MYLWVYIANIMGRYGVLTFASVINLYECFYIYAIQCAGMEASI
jgi:hypothetical protein